MTQVGSYPPRRTRRDTGHLQARPVAAPQAYRRAAPPPVGAELDRRGRHATGYGQGFSWVLIWTILGAVIPGAGLIAAGRRALGGAVLFLLGLGIAVLAVLALVGNPLKRGLALAVDPQALLIVTIAIAALGALWAGVILLTSSQLRRYAVLSSGQRAFSGLVVLALLAGVGLPAFKIGQSAMITRGLVTSDSIFAGNDDSTSTGPDTQKKDPWANKPRVNVLLIGSDAGADRTGVRPDTMILASIDTASGNTVLFSLPRSLQKATFAPGTPGAEAWPDGYNCGDQCLINAIWTWAESAPGYAKFKNPGLAATRDAVEGVTGLEVDNYVMLNLNGFRDFVDAIGRITVDVHERLPIGGNGDVNSRVYHVATGGWIEKGNNQKLDGYHALWFARSRWASDDYSRMQRQRCVIGAVVKKADPVTLAMNFAGIAKALKKNLATGISTSQINAWVELSLRVKGATVTSLPFTRSVIDTVNPDIPRVHELVQQALTASLAEPTPEPSVTASASPSASPTKKPTRKPAKPVDPSKAQDLSAVC